MAIKEEKLVKTYTSKVELIMTNAESGSFGSSVVQPPHNYTMESMDAQMSDRNYHRNQNRGRPLAGEFYQTIGG